MAEAHSQTGILQREQIVAAARSLVEEQGLDALTMRTLARRLGYSPASLYMHFRGKDELLRAVAAESAAGLLERIERAARGEDPADGLRAFAEQIIGFAQGSEALDRLIFDETPGSPFGSEEEALRTRLFQRLAVLVERASAARSAAAASFGDEDDELATALAWGELRGIARLVRAGGPDPAAARKIGSRRPATLAEAWLQRWLGAS